MIRKLILLVLSLTAAGAAAQRHDRWEIIGPGGGGAQFIPAINPGNPKDVFVACDMTGAYLSHDGGNTWRMFNLGGVVVAFVFDPTDARIYYARTSGQHSGGRGGALWRSTDAGDTWRLIYPDPATVTGVFAKDDHAMNSIASSANLPGEIVALTVDPFDYHLLTP